MSIRGRLPKMKPVSGKSSGATKPVNFMTGASFIVTTESNMVFTIAALGPLRNGLYRTLEWRKIGGPPPPGQGSDFGDFALARGGGGVRPPTEQAE